MRGTPDRTGGAADLLVIGGGIVGAATAFFAARHGLSCTVLESRPAPASFTTARAAGGYRLQLEHEVELALVRRSAELYANFVDETGQSRYSPALRRQGYLWLTTDEGTAARQRELVASQRRWGLDDVELLDRAALRSRFPWVSESVIQARFRARDGLIDPVAITLGLLQGSGATVKTGTLVTGFAISGGRLAGVETDAGTIACDHAVIACGPLSGRLSARAGVELPIQTVRRQRVTIAGAPQVPAGAPMTIDEDTTAHWRPFEDGAIALFPATGEPATEPLDEVPPDLTFAARVLDPESPTALARTVPFWRDVWNAGRARWTVEAGQYTMTPDQLPLIGRTAVDGLWVNTGYSGHGVMAGPGGSELLADLIVGARPHESNAFAPERELHQTTQLW